MSVFPVWSFTIAAMLSSCGQGSHDPERFVLTGNDKNLFFQTQIPIDPRRVDEVIVKMKRFAREHSMDVLVARESMPLGDFNVSVNSPNINIKAMHTAAVGDTGVRIFAVVPNAPTTADKERVLKLVDELRTVD